MAGGIRRQERARFDGQRIRADMRGLESEDVGERPGPVVDRLPCRAEDQVDVEIGEARGPRHRDSRFQVAWAMRAAQ